MDFLTLKMTLSHKNNTRNGLPSQNHMKMRYYTCSWLYLLKNHIWPWNIGGHFVLNLVNDLSTSMMTLDHRHNAVMHFQTKSHEKEVLHMFQALIVKNGIFAYLTLKLTFWPWRWPWIIKIMQEMDCPVKITWKWGITLVPGFIC